MLFVNNVQEIEPKIILDEKNHLRRKDFNKSPAIFYRIERKIKYKVGLIVASAHLISGGGEKSQKNLFFGPAFPQCFYHRSPLLKFAKGGNMKPDDGVFFSVNLL